VFPTRTRSIPGRLRALAASAAVGLLGLVAEAPARALSFNLICSGDPTCASFNSSAYAGFQAAAARWSALFSDPFTLNLAIGFTPLQPNVLAQAGSVENLITYSYYRSLLGLDRTSSDDQQAHASLGSGSSFNLLINRTADNPNGVGSATPYLDNNGGLNNTWLWANTAIIKALGVTPVYDLANTSLLDASITFTSTLPNSYIWDFDPSDGIASNALDFIGVAAHEIGHALGFVSGVDTLDINSPNNSVNPPAYYNADVFEYVSPLDLYRYSALSAATAGGVIDWTADTRAKYFSLDRGITNLGPFSTGTAHGDGRQASHWQDNLVLGLMDPTFAAGELGVISALDVRSLDVIGYDLSSLTSRSVPAPLPLFGAAAALGWSRRLRRRLAAHRHPANPGSPSSEAALDRGPAAPLPPAG
jgi:hypothetical protein